LERARNYKKYLLTEACSQLRGNPFETKAAGEIAVCKRLKPAGAKRQSKGTGNQGSKEGGTQEALKPKP